MNIKESIQQINELIEAWELNEACLNQTDIDAIKCLLKQNQELKEQLEEKTKIGISDHKYASKCEDKVITMENQQKEFIDYLEKIIIDSKAGSGQQYYYQQVLEMYKEIIGGIE